MEVTSQAHGVRHMDDAMIIDFISTKSAYDAMLADTPGACSLIRWGKVAVPGGGG